jgi:hypothetical protein
VLIELGLGGRKSSGEVIVIQSRIDDFVAVVLQVGRFDAAWDRVPAVKEEDFHWVESSFSFKQLGQYQGAGVFTGFGLRLRHLAQRNRLPFTAVFGRACFPVLKMFFAIATSTRILSDCVLLVLRDRLRPWSSQGNSGERAVTPPASKCVE